jgi:hypothetical protein
MRFPAYYGRNRDAFRDLVTGGVDMTAPLRLVGGDIVQQRLPRDAALRRRCPADLHAQHPALSCDVVYD